MTEQDVVSLLDTLTGRLATALTHEKVGNYLIYREFKPSRDSVEFTVYTAIPYRLRMDFEFALKDALPDYSKMNDLVRETYDDGLAWMEENGIKNRRYLTTESPK